MCAVQRNAVFVFTNVAYVYSHLAVVLQPQPLALLEEDIREVLKLETGTDIFHKSDYQSDHRAWKHNVSLTLTLL